MNDSLRFVVYTRAGRGPCVDSFHTFDMARACAIAEGGASVIVDQHLDPGEDDRIVWRNEK